jgi:hypothetical protein
MRSVTGLPDNPDDHATVCGNGRDAAPYEPAGRTLTEAEVAAEMRRICGPILDKIRGREQSNHRCKHGINLEQARCATCAPLTETELGR